MLIVTFGSAELDIDKVAGSQAVSFCSSPSLEQGCRDVGLLASASPGRREGLAVIWQVECKGGAPAWGMQPAAPGVWPRARPLMPEAFPIKSKPCSAWGRRGPRFLPTVDDDIRSPGKRPCGRALAGALSTTTLGRHVQGSTSRDFLSRQSSNCCLHFQDQ